MSPASIWYLSKYVSPPALASAGGRGFLLMRELARLGHKCTIITSDSNKLAKVPALTSSHLIHEVEGITFCWLRTMKYSTAKSIRRIFSWIDFELKLLFLPISKLDKPDVVIVSSLSILTIINGFRLRHRFKCRLVFEIRDIWPLTITEEGGYSRRNPFVMILALVEYLGYRNADAIVGTMPNLSKHVEQILGYQREVHCIPMGIDPTTIEDMESLAEDYIRAHIPVGKFIVAHVGSIGITNALDSFFECATLMSSIPEIHFLLVGDGDLRSRYQDIYRNLSNISFAPAVPKRMVQDVLSRCDLLYFATFPSKVWEYGQSLNKVIDYMLAAKPIVASYSGFPSMINESGCGTFVPSSDSLQLKQEILRYFGMSHFERQSIGAQGRMWILKNRTYPALAKQYCKIILPSN